MLLNSFHLTLNFPRCPDFLCLSKSNIPIYNQSRREKMQIFLDNNNNSTGDVFSCITRLTAAAGLVHGFFNEP